MLSKLNNLSASKKSAINIISCIIVVAINTLINLFLSPFIVDHISVEANGFISLANNFVSYLTIIFTALDSLAGRFILIERCKGNNDEANGFYSSVFFGNWILGVILVFPSMYCILHIDRFIQVAPELISDIQLLFFLIFANFFIGVFLPKWDCAPYVTNNLFLRSIASAFAAIVRVASIVFLFSIWKPAAYFVGIAGLLMTATGKILAHWYHKSLTPELKVKLKNYSFQKVKVLIFSGIWNTVSQCGNILLEGVDLLISNLFIDEVAMGVLALSKIIPNMLNQIVGTIATTFSPRLAQYYAHDDFDSIEKEVKQNVKILSIIAAVPIGIAFVYGETFFKLWVPSQNAQMLSFLSNLTLMGIAVTGISKCITNIFAVTNQLRLNSVLVIFSGVASILVVYFLLKYSSLGVYAVAGVSSIVSIIRELFFTVPYAAKCIHKNLRTFYGSFICGVTYIAIPAVISYVFSVLLMPKTWMWFLLAITLASFVSVCLEVLLCLNKNEKKALLSILARKK